MVLWLLSSYSKDVARSEISQNLVAQNVAVAAGETMQVVQEVVH